MSDFRFTPTDQSQNLHVPFYEDARADFAPYYDIRNKTIGEAQKEVVTEMGKLGAHSVIFQEGYFGEGKQRRYGYVIQFGYSTARGVIRVAGLPMKQEHTGNKIRKVRLQALMNVRDWLKSAVTSQVFAPGNDVLIQHLLIDGQRTVADYITQTGNLPRLNPPAVDGFIE